jgi:hypothetical protein
MKSVSVFSLFALAVVSATPAHAESVIVEQVTNRAKVALFRPQGQQPRCPNCATVGVALHETMAIGAPRISKVTVSFRGQETELTDFRATHRCPGSPAVANQTFTLELPLRTLGAPSVELAFYARNCMNPTVPSCRDLREVSRVKVPSWDLVNLVPTTEEQAVQELIGESRRACSPALPRAVR